MTAPGGSNFFSKAARRAAKAISPGTGFETVEESDTAEATPPRKTSGFQTVHYDPPGHEARKAVEGAEREVEKKHGKMKK